jgi:mannose-6-phosphate isomerase
MTELPESIHEHAKGPAIVRLHPELRRKPWGTLDLSPWYAAQAEKTGEVWFTSGETTLPLLIKFLFTDDKLSVQVHPNDEYARRWEGCAGKTEMWHILQARPDACVALGFREPVSKQQLVAAAQSGEIDRLLEWRTVRRGETYLVPAGTVHAIGPGVVLCEVQQNSDITYRLYDFGRGRELHLLRASDVANLGRHPGPAVPSVLSGGRELLVECPYFTVERRIIETSFSHIASGQEFWVVLSGNGRWADRPFQAGEVWMLSPGAGEIIITPEQPVEFLHVK